MNQLARAEVQGGGDVAALVLAGCDNREAWAAWNPCVLSGKWRASLSGRE
jgi:hypothetical protein